MDGDSIPRCTIAARSLRCVLLQESHDWFRSQAMKRWLVVCCCSIARRD